MIPTVKVDHIFFCHVGEDNRFVSGEDAQVAHDVAHELRMLIILCSTAVQSFYKTPWKKT